MKLKILKFLLSLQHQNCVRLMQWGLQYFHLFNQFVPSGALGRPAFNIKQRNEFENSNLDIFVSNTGAIICWNVNLTLDNSVICFNHNSLYITLIIKICGTNPILPIISKYNGKKKISVNPTFGDVCLN